MAADLDGRESWSILTCWSSLSAGVWSMPSPKLNRTLLMLPVKGKWDSARRYRDRCEWTHPARRLAPQPATAGRIRARGQAETNERGRHDDGNRQTLEASHDLLLDSPGTTLRVTRLHVPLLPRRNASHDLSTRTERPDRRRHGACDAVAPPTRCGRVDGACGRQLRVRTTLRATGLAGAAEHVVRLVELVEREAVGDEAVHVDPRALGQAQQRPFRVGA
jgi:hypothetical protein